MLKPRLRGPSRIVLLIIGLVTVGSTVTTAATLADGAAWVKKSFSVEGTWVIEEENGRKYIVLSDDFKTKSAPDLKIFLSKHSVADASNKNATEGAVLVGELPRVKGAVRLEIPAGTDLDQFRSLLLHCEQYRKLWAAASLR